MLARSGEITRPCPVPLSSTVTIPSSRMPALSHALVADPVLQEANQPTLADRPEEVLDVGVKYPVHFPYFDRRRQRVQRIVRPSPRSEPVRETAEVAFIDGVERHDGCTLHDLVFQGGDRERPLPPIGLRYVRPARRLRSISSPVDPSMKIVDPRFEVRLVVMPRHAIHAGGGFALKRVECSPERVGIDVVEERGELSLLPSPCGFPYAVQRLGHAHPALGPVRALLVRVPLGPRPWLRRLLSQSPGFVRRLRGYYAGVLTSLGRASAATAPHLPVADHVTQKSLWPIQRSPGSRARSVHTCQGLRPRRVGRALALAHPSILPSDE